ncbi:hypothetical protein IPH25_03290 [bacterium]|nr:MAG: hypothetical protein IPG37_00280 [bacterium]QQR61491.1 MAG: hypothetical protein IPH25_03290 [bacterium]QQR62981.1 MAG: hypothetical protein IPH67_00710 [bacterium]
MPATFHQPHKQKIKIGFLLLFLITHLQALSMNLHYEHMFINNTNDYSVDWYTKVVDLSGRITDQAFYLTQRYFFDSNYHFNQQTFEIFFQNPYRLLTLIKENKDFFELRPNEVSYYESYLVKIGQPNHIKTAKAAVLKFLYLNPHREAIFSAIVKNSLDIITL